MLVVLQVQAQVPREQCRQETRRQCATVPRQDCRTEPRQQCRSEHSYSQPLQKEISHFNIKEPISFICGEILTDLFPLAPPRPHRATAGRSRGSRSPSSAAPSPDSSAPPPGPRWAWQIILR